MAYDLYIYFYKIICSIAKNNSNNINNWTNNKLLLKISLNNLIAGSSWHTNKLLKKFADRLVKWFRYYWLVKNVCLVFLMLSFENTYFNLSVYGCVPIWMPRIMFWITQT